MTKIIFTKTRHTYDSYTDFWRLVTASSFETCYVDEIDLNKSKDTVYIVTPWNGETRPALERARNLLGNAKTNSKIVWYCLERDLSDGERTIDDELDLVDEVWVSDKSFSNFHPKFKFVLMGGHEDFGDRFISNISSFSKKQHDVCTLAYLWGRRLDIVNTLKSKGIKITPEAFGKDMQDIHVPSSLLMLNMHQYDFPGKPKIVAPLRFAVTASYKLPLLTEEVTDASPFIENVHFQQAKYEDLVSHTLKLLSDVEALNELSENLYQFLVVENPFDKTIKQAVTELL